ncbi:tetratricopeptide repeat protein [Nostoc sp. UHCC 0926]|uniref:tetratricopeptide repeat protein n=1 Tax=unclassified Nostoc TaxID=2593658 RepID=UPI00235DDBFD|nr:tetratricopeptide repeat protein [Nostoc sp. UHCC 0926]WDD32717.1 tetratricopeptide repeat protein [Nostoc sp. UHCC 0926]
MEIWFNENPRASDIKLESNTLNLVTGRLYSLGQYPKALEYYQQALAIFKQIGDRSDVGTTLNNISYLLDR